VARAEGPRAAQEAGAGEEAAPALAGGRGAHDGGARVEAEEDELEERGRGRRARTSPARSLLSSTLSLSWACPRVVAGVYLPPWTHM
jgi:hypothetical protein